MIATIESRSTPATGTSGRWRLPCSPARRGRLVGSSRGIDRILLSFAGRLSSCLQMTHAEIRLGNGDVYTVEGTLDEVERGLSDAARSGQARLAWFKERGTAESIGINPAHVAALRGGETSD